MWGDEKQLEARHVFRDLVHSKYFPRAIMEAVLFSLVTGYVFYKSPVGMLFIFVFSLFTLKKRVKELEAAERQKNALAFVELLHVIRRLSASGLSIQACFNEAEHEMKSLYPDENAWIMTSLKDLNTKLMLDPYPGPYIIEWGQVEGLSEITDFGRVVTVIQEYGGDMVEKVSVTARTISQRIETDRHVWVLASSKVFEQKVLFYLGYLMIMLLNSVLPEMFEVLYETVIGVAVMTLSLSLMVAGRSIGTHLTKIEV